MPQQSLSNFVSAMEAAGMLVRVKEEKLVDKLPRVMEDHPATATILRRRGLTAERGLPELK